MERSMRVTRLDRVGTAALGCPGDRCSPGFVCSSSQSRTTAGLRPDRTAEGGCPYVENLRGTISAYRTNSAAARRIAPAAAYAHIVCAVAQPVLPSYFAGREQYRDPLPRAHSPDLHPESPPSTPRTASPPAL